VTNVRVFWRRGTGIVSDETGCDATRCDAMQVLTKQHLDNIICRLFLPRYTTWRASVHRTNDLKLLFHSHAHALVD
jgi:hypothetical protein